MTNYNDMMNEITVVSKEITRNFIHGEKFGIDIPIEIFEFEQERVKQIVADVKEIKDIITMHLEVKKYYIRLVVPSTALVDIFNCSNIAIKCICLKPGGVFVVDYEKELDLEYETFIKKNADYGSSFEESGVIGVLVRMGDKVNRCLNLIGKKEIIIKDENIVDTLRDLSIYSKMAMMLLLKESKINIRDVIYTRIYKGN